MHVPVAICWDDDNEARHLEKHGLIFAFAAAIFADPDRLVAADLGETHDPPRFNAVGVVDGICLHVTYAMDGDAAVIISARSASRKERRRYGAYHPD